MPEHGLLHERVAGADRDAVAARDAARFADRRSAVPQDARVRILPSDRQRLVHLDVLAGLYAAAAENALAGVVAIERIRAVDLVRLRAERDPLMRDGEQLGRVVNRAVPIVVVTDGAVEEVISQDPVESLALRCARIGGLGRDVHSGGDRGRARPHELAFQLHHAGVTGLDGAESRVVTDLGQLGTGAIQEIDEAFAGFRIDGRAVDRDPEDSRRIPTHFGSPHAARSRCAPRLSQAPCRRVARRSASRRTGKVLDGG